MCAVDLVPEFFAIGYFFVEHFCVDHGCEADIGAVVSAEEAEGQVGLVDHWGYGEGFIVEDGVFWVEGFVVWLETGVVRVGGD